MVCECKHASRPKIQIRDSKPRTPNPGPKTQYSKPRTLNPGSRAGIQTRTSHSGTQSQEFKPGIQTKCRPRHARNRGTANMWTTHFIPHFYHNSIFKTQESKARTPNPGMQAQDSKPRTPNPGFQTGDSKARNPSHESKPGLQIQDFKPRRPYPGIRTQVSKSRPRNPDPPTEPGILTSNPNPRLQTQKSKLRNPNHDVKQGIQIKD